MQGVEHCSRASGPVRIFLGFHCSTGGSDTRRQRTRDARKAWGQAIPLLLPALALRRSAASCPATSAFLSSSWIVSSLSSRVVRLITGCRARGAGTGGEAEGRRQRAGAEGMTAGQGG